MFGVQPRFLKCVRCEKGIQHAANSFFGLSANRVREQGTLIYCGVTTKLFRAKAGQDRHIGRFRTVLCAVKICFDILYSMARLESGTSAARLVDFGSRPSAALTLAVSSP